MAEWTIKLPDFVVVTGTASGLGMECAIKLLEAGSTVVGVDLGDVPTSLDEHQSYHHVQSSTTLQDTWDTVLRLAQESQSTTVAYIGCAAILTTGLLEEEALDSWRKTWEVNVLGNVMALKTLMPVFKAADAASIVAVSSIDADFGEQQLAAYASSKAALSGAIRSIALDYGRSGINVNILAPGPMRAGLFNRHLASADDPARFLATREARQPRGRITGADEVADAALFLVSPSARAMFGSTLVADGGLTTGFDFRTGEEGAAVAANV